MIAQLRSFQTFRDGLPRAYEAGKDGFVYPFQALNKASASRPGFFCRLMTGPPSLEIVTRSET
jgi:hypothetical protein